MSYREMIATATGIEDRQSLDAIEDHMRHVIFHSTLDWQSPAQFRKGARESVVDLHCLALIGAGIATL